MKNLLPVLIVPMLLAGLTAHAQSQAYWDAVSPIHASPGAGGTGNWNTTSGNTVWWVSGSSDSIWANGNIANFAGNAATVTVNTSVIANGLSFATTGYTIGGSSTLTLGGSPSAISLPATSGTTTISCPLTVSSGMTLSGVSGDILDLTGSDTVTGNITISSGTFEIGGSGKLTTTTSGTYSGTIANASSLNYSSSASQTFSGVVSGAGSLAVNGGTLTLTAANTYSGGTTISSGKTLTLSGGGKLGNGTYSANITDNGTLNYNSTQSQTLNGVISGSGSLSVNPGGSLGNLLYINGANTYTGATTLAAAGQIIIKSDSGLGAPPASFAATQLLFEYGFLNANASLTLNANRGIYLAAGSQSIGASIQVSPGDTLTLAAPISGAAGLGVIFGSGEPTFGYGTNLLAASSTYTGATAISTGRLMLGKSGALPTGTILVMAPDDAPGNIIGGNLAGSIFDLNGFNQTIGPLYTTNTFYAPAGIGNNTPTILLTGTLTILQTNVSTGFGGVITGPGNLVISGNSSGELILSNADSFTGLTTINGGTLDGNASGSISSSVVINGGTLELDTATTMNSTNTLTMGSSVTVNLNFSGTQTIAGLEFGSTPQATGLWGAVGNSSATYTDSRFTGSGLLLVCPAPQTITPATSPLCAGATTTASVPVTAGATYSWSVGNGTIDSGGNSSTVTYTAMAYSPVTLNCVVTSPCGVQSPGNQNVMVPVNVCGLIVQASNVVYSPNSGAMITVTGVVGATWYLNASTNASAPLPWPTIQIGTVYSSPFIITDTTALNYPQQFYYLTNSLSQ